MEKLRLFQPEHYNYCSPLLAIGRKPKKRCGDKPPMVPRRRAGTVCAMLYRLAWIYNRDAPEHPYIPYCNM
nr:MAG TPA: hypothetical protein [Caudoviricetes sp.]